MAKRIDGTQREVVQVLRKLGVNVHITSDLGKGFPDLVIGLKGRVFLIEVKNGKLSPSKQKLTPDEKEFHYIWKDYVYIIKSVDEAIDFVNSMPWKRKVAYGCVDRIENDGVH